MNTKLILFATFLLSILISCKSVETKPKINVVFLHHSTGGVIYRGNNSIISKVSRRLGSWASDVVDSKGVLPTLFKQYSKSNNKEYSITEMEFPKEKPYGWRNYPFDYYNIWVKNAGENPYMDEPTLEILSKKYDVIIFKHCYPVSNIEPDKDTADIDSDIQTLTNYKLQYLALRDKLHSFPQTKFIILTGAAQVKNNITEDEALRAKEFFSWVIDGWDLPEDNIYIWDLYSLQTEGGLYLKDQYAASPTDSHPNKNFAGRIAKLFFYRIVDIIENNGSTTKLTGEGI